MADKIDLNHSDRDELASLPEIDEEVAQRIVEYRETVRPFSDVSELSAVDGISEETLEAIGDRLTVSAMAEDSPAEELESQTEDESMVEEEGLPETEPDNPPVNADKQNGRAPAAAEVSPPSEDGEKSLDEDEIVIMTGSEVEAGTPEEMVETASAEASPVPESGVAIAAPQQAPARSGSSFWGHLLAASLGAVCGVVLTLAFLMLLNGTLRLNDTADINELETQVGYSVATMEAEQSGLNENIDSLDERITILDTVDKETASSLADTKADLVVVENDLAGVTGDVGTLQEKAAELDERLVAVAISAENFDAFLSGLRDLLATMPEPSAGSVLSPTETITTTVPEPTPSALKTEGSPTPMVTRTPRPTATPFALPDR